MFYQIKQAHFSCFAVLAVHGHSPLYFHTPNGVNVRGHEPRTQDVGLPNATADTIGPAKPMGAKSPTS